MLQPPALTAKSQSYIQNKLFPFRSDVPPVCGKSTEPFSTPHLSHGRREKTDTMVNPADFGGHIRREFETIW